MGTFSCDCIQWYMYCKEGDLDSWGVGIIRALPHLYSIPILSWDKSLKRSYIMTCQALLVGGATVSWIGVALLIILGLPHLVKAKRDILTKAKRQVGQSQDYNKGDGYSQVSILVLLPHLVKAKRNIRHYTNKDEEASGAVVWLTRLQLP